MGHKARRNSRTARRRRGATTRGNCSTGKLRFAGRVEAMIALADTSRPQGSSHREEQRFYFCAKCSGWHLTSQGFRRTSPTHDAEGR